MALVLVGAVLLALGAAMVVGLSRRRVDEHRAWLVPDLRLWAAALGLLLAGVGVLVAGVLGS